MGQEMQRSSTALQYLGSSTRSHDVSRLVLTRSGQESAPGQANVKIPPGVIVLQLDTSGQQNAAIRHPFNIYESQAGTYIPSIIINNFAEI